MVIVLIDKNWHKRCDSLGSKIKTATFNGRRKIDESDKVVSDFTCSSALARAHSAGGVCGGEQLSDLPQ
jgi:hypothetical protein